MMSDLKVPTIKIDQQKQQLRQAAETLEGQSPQDVLRWAIDHYGDGLSLACSFGMQSVAMIDMLWRMDLLKRVEVFYLDTSVLFSQTHQTRLRVQERYGFRAVRVSSALSWEQQKIEHGGDLYDQGAKGVEQCCEIRKVKPTRDYLIQRRQTVLDQLADQAADSAESVDMASAGQWGAGWVTGMRRRHNQHRESLPVALWDEVNQIAKFNPMATLDDATIWGYIKANDVPYNALYDQGYPSIGCDTPVCTRPVAEGDDPRSGRWSGLDKTECGIHLDGDSIQSLGSSNL